MTRYMILLVAALAVLCGTVKTTHAHGPQRAGCQGCQQYGWARGGGQQ